ncbi:C-factor-like [Bradysia coprophila]|uniref:C-factor-like n=1 Tax=Bradysia coprophila TaxID=38358 RepID=UPI00187DB584|nr:C-factor-like [Bradysia coprophila]
MAKTIVITGANRGLGLEFVRQYLKLDSPPQLIVATCRDPDKATELRELADSNASVYIYKLDTTDLDALPNFANRVDELVDENGLDVLINNAGAYLKVSLLEGSSDDLMENFKINAVAPFMLTRTLFSALRKATAKNDAHRPAVVNITSKMGSMDDNTSGGHYAYRTSKAALNMITKSMSVDLASSGIKAVAIHPGWVRTAMGGPNGLIDTIESVTNMIRVIGEVQTGKNKGLFLNYNGAEIKW